MEYVGRIELATPRLYHMEDVTPPHQNLADYLDQKPSLEFMNIRTDLRIITKRKAAVVYHISRNGLLEHPHFLDVPISSAKGLYLKDVINALNSIRGPGMANLYSWSAKRSHGKGFVWKDLTEKDLIQPYDDDHDHHHHQYILKGSPLPELSTWNLRSPDNTTLTSSTSKGSTDSCSSLGDEFDSPVIRGKSFGRSTFEDVDDAGVEMKPHKKTTSMEINEVIDSGFSTPRNDGIAKKVDGYDDAKEGNKHRRETLHSAMMRTDHEKLSSSPSSTPPKPIVRKSGRGSSSSSRTAGLLRTLVTCGSKTFR